MTILLVKVKNVTLMPGDFGELSINFRMQGKVVRVDRYLAIFQVDYCRLGLFKTLYQRTAALVGWARRYTVG